MMNTRLVDCPLEQCPRCPRVMCLAKLKVSTVCPSIKNTNRSNGGRSETLSVVDLRSLVNKYEAKPNFIIRSVARRSEVRRRCIQNLLPRWGYPR